MMSWIDCRFHGDSGYVNATKKCVVINFNMIKIMDKKEGLKNEYKNPRSFVSDLEDWEQEHQKD